MCRRPSCTNKYGAMADFPPTSSKKTCKNLPPLKKTLGLLQQKLPLGRTKGFPTAPPPRPSLACRLSAYPYLAMAMALKLVCPSEMAFWMAVRSAHTPRL